jgi:hypothetical protein
MLAFLLGCSFFILGFTGNQLSAATYVAPTDSLLLDLHGNSTRTWVCTYTDSLALAEEKLADGSLRQNACLVQQKSCLSFADHGHYSYQGSVGVESSLAYEVEGEVIRLFDSRTPTLTIARYRILQHLAGRLLLETTELGRQGFVTLRYWWLHRP